MQAVLSVLPIVVGVFVSLIALLFVAAWIYFGKSVKSFTDAVSSIDRTKELNQSIFQLYKELTIHGGITHQSAERFTREYRKYL